MDLAEQPNANRNDYIGLFLLVMATIAFEILLTRIFSVTMWYHFAFMAISIAMFGMTVGAIIVYSSPTWFSGGNIRPLLLVSSVCFAISIVISFAVHFSIPCYLPKEGQVSFMALSVTYLVVAIPFMFSGIATCLALTKFPKQVGKLYATDLIGASFGCLLIIPLLTTVDGPSAILFVAALAATAAIFFCQTGQSKRYLALSVLVLVFLLVGGITNAVLAKNHQQFFRIQWAQNNKESVPLYEKWNCFSRIMVYGDPKELHRPMAWGLSSTWPEDKKVSELLLTIDGIAWTVLTGFNGDWSKTDYLKCDVTNLAHNLRPNANVLVVGVGGGRDILSALAYKQKSVAGVEINGDILNTLTNVYGDYTGHLDGYRQVKLINDEARSFIGSSKEKYDIIEISLVDTCAASAAGAFVLTENSLYTIEAWQDFLDHLSPGGVLSVSRWYVKSNPVELYRLESLAASALLKVGVGNPRENIIIVAQMAAANGGRAGSGIATLLVSKQPFSPNDINAAAKFANAQKFGILLSPDTALNLTFVNLTVPKYKDRVVSAFPGNISPPTDNNPFFFYFLNASDFLKGDLNSSVVTLLGHLSIVIVVLTLLSAVIPLLWMLLPGRYNQIKRAYPFLLYFGCIGLGFMFIEMSQVQRLIIFLGHPVYGLSVVLFTLLLSSGIGSFFITTRRDVNQKICLYALLVLLLLFGILTPVMASALSSASTIVRIAASIAILMPLGFFMGMCFPIGMQIANEQDCNLTPWLWGVNGATSVCASVLAVLIAINFGISASFWTGTVCYCLAVGTLLWLRNSRSG